MVFYIYQILDKFLEQPIFFKTNYDLIIEKATDKVLKNFKFVFNDGASGYFDRKLESTNYNRTVSYKGLNDNYTNELPSLTLIKPHGLVNWEKMKSFCILKIMS
ncbi:hypothetical protein EH319_11860 [Enterococcus faecium]|nr:hypothetical protein [Enterococcus faecium]